MKTNEDRLIQHNHRIARRLNGGGEVKRAKFTSGERHPDASYIGGMLQRFVNWKEKFNFLLTIKSETAEQRETLYSKWENTQPQN